MNHLTFFLLVAAMALAVPAVVLAIGLAQRAAGSVEPWRRLDHARLAFSVFPRRVRNAAGALAMVIAICIFAGAMIAAVGGAFYPPVVGIAAPYVCDGKSDALSRDYSYRPGQSGVAHNFLCAHADGEQHDVTWPAFVAAALFYSMTALFLVLLLLGLKRLISQAPFSNQQK
jgi:hypothetical protein